MYKFTIFFKNVENKDSNEQLNVWPNASWWAVLAAEKWIVYGFHKVPWASRFSLSIGHIQNLVYFRYRN